MLASPKVSIILPIFNEEENVSALLTEISEAMGPAGVPYEVLAVDDGSTDQSFHRLKEIAQQMRHLRVIRFQRNVGQTGAFDAGFRHASGDILVTMDADRQNDPKDIPRMLALLDEGYDFVTGWRRDRKDGLWHRKLPSKIANFIIRRVTRTRVRDLGCSLKVYKRNFVKNLRLYGEMHRFLSVLIEDQGARMAQIEVNHRPRVAGKSKYNLSRTFKVLLDLLTVWFLRRYQTKPSYFFGGVGILFSFTSVFLFALTLFEKFEEGVKVHRNPLFMLGIFFGLMSVQFLVLGLLGELLVRTYFESSQKTPYYVSETIN